MSDNIAVASTTVAGERDQLKRRCLAHELYEHGLRSALKYWMEYADGLQRKADRYEKTAERLARENSELRLMLFKHENPWWRRVGQRVLLWMATR